MDDDLEMRILACLASVGRAELRGVHVTVRGTDVALTGTVCSFVAKQLAQELARRVPGVLQVENQIQVEE